MGWQDPEKNLDYFLRSIDKTLFFDGFTVMR